MVKRPAPQAVALDLTVRERVLLLCVSSGANWRDAGIRGEVALS